MKQYTYTHAIQIDTDKCIGCSHCMRVCPTEAIRIEGGHAHIRSVRCVDCGECFRVCPQRAIYVKDDGLAAVKSSGYRIALLPSIFIGQFPSEYSATRILEAVRQIGFDDVFEVEQAVDMVKNEYRLLENEIFPLPAITSFCPAVVRMIQVLYPALTDQIVRLKAPHDIAALYLRRSKEKEGIRPSEIYIYYITPCAAKIVAARDPVAEKNSPIDGTIDMKIIYNLVSKIIREDKNLGLHKSYANMSPDSVCWSLSGTEKKYFSGRSLAIDGMNNVIEFLDKLESGQLAHIDFLEMRACDQGCAGGILCPGNRFLAVERLEQRQKKLEKLKLQNEGKVTNMLFEFSEELHRELQIDAVEPREGLQLDEDIGKAIQKMKHIKKLMTFLPGFDCGACGAPSCRALAEDIAQDRASISYCVFVQRVMEKNYKLSPEQSFSVIEKIWGQNRLNKYTDENES